VLRPFGLHDMVAMRQLQGQSVPLDVRRRLLYRDAPARDALIGFLTRHHLGPLTWMLGEDDDAWQGKAFAQVWSVPARRDWNLIAMAPALDADAHVESTWRDMLQALVPWAVENGVFRIVSRVDEGSEPERVLRTSGYIATVRQELFRLESHPGAVACPRGLQPAHPRHDWALGELYYQVVPPAVQDAEAAFSRACAGPRRYLLGGESAREYVWQDAERVNAYLAIAYAPQGLWLNILVRPEYRADIAPHVRYVLGQVQETDPRPIYCAVPDYAVGIGWVLRTLGFQAAGRHAHMVQHVAARVPVWRPLVVRGMDGAVDIRASVGTAQGTRSEPHTAYEAPASGPVARS